MTPRERLERTAVVIDRFVPASSHVFDMNRWFSETECGGAGCVIGWAAQDPELQKDGLSLVKHGPEISPEFGIYRGWDAVMHFYNLGLSDAGYLFAVYSYSGYAFQNPKAVAVRIRQFLAARDHAEN